MSAVATPPSHLVGVDTSGDVALKRTSDSFRFIVPVVTPISDKPQLAPRTMSINLLKPLMFWAGGAGEVVATSTLGVKPASTVYDSSKGKLFIGSGDECRFVPRLVADIEFKPELLTSIEFHMHTIAGSMMDSLKASGLARWRVLVPDLAKLTVPVSGCNSLVSNVISARTEGDESVEYIASMEWTSTPVSESEKMEGDTALFYMRNGDRYSAVHPNGKRMVGPQDLAGASFSVIFKISKLPALTKADAWMLQPQVAAFLIEPSEGPKRVFFAPPEPPKLVNKSDAEEEDVEVAVPIDHVVGEAPKRKKTVKRIRLDSVVESK